MIGKILAVVVVALLIASVSCAEDIIDVLTSSVEAAASGINKTVSNANPGKIISDTVEGTEEAAQKAGEATLGGAANIVGVASN